MKILVSDYDDTMFFSEYSNEQYSEQLMAIKKWRDDGHLFIINTGRYFGSIKRAIDNYNIPFDYLLAGNGSTIYDNNFNVLHSEEMNNDSIDQVVKILNTYNPNQPILFTNHEQASNERPEVVTALFQKVLNEGLASDLNSELNNINDVFCYLSVNYINVNHQRVNKSFGLDKLLELKNLKDKKLYVVGDSYNDLPMIRDYQGYQIGNKQILKEVAKGSYPSIKDFIIDIEKEVI